MFSDKLLTAISKTSPICVGIDPMLDKFPKYLLRDYSPANAILRFNEEIIDAVADLVPAIKPQMAYFEMFGTDGLRALATLTEYAKDKGLLVILDGKRNDIASTANAYAESYLSDKSEIKADALTVNPYLGSDGIMPFIEACKNHGKGLFVLVKTSNPSSGELQDMKLESGKYVYEHISNLVNQWGDQIVDDSGYSSIGAVVGATHPEQASKIRSLLPRQIFLVPGYGAQGGTAQDVLPCFNEDKYGAIINASRSILYAYQKRENIKEKDFAVAARDEVVRMINDISGVLI